MTARIRTLVAPVLALALLASCRGGVRGSGVAKTETRTVAAFDAVHASTGVEVDVTVGANGPIEVTADDNLIADVKTELSGHTLEVGIVGNKAVNPATRISVKVPAAEVRGLGVSSGAVLSAEHVNAKMLDLESSSGGIMKVDGTAESVSFKASSGSKIDAAKLGAIDATLQASSGAVVRMRVSGKVEGSASSGASVSVEGSPATRSISTSSGAEVHY